MRPSLLAWFLALIPSAAVAGAPFWAQHDSQRLDGKIFRIVCSGTGPSIGFARQNALDSCKVSAAQQLATDVVVKSVSVTSETQAAFQQEVVNESQVTGLSCTPKREETEETDAEVKLWLLCEFRGGSPARVVSCGGLNPVSVVLRPDDRELTLRAKDYLPKTLFLGPERAARDYVQVYLEPNP
jgi:hypothetical protein